MVKNGRGGKRNQHRSRHRPPTQEPTLSPSGRTLPADLILKILCRTPVRSLVRFRCVCKSWYVFIFHPKFVAMHLNSNTLGNNHIVFHAYNLNSTRSFISLLRVNDLPITVFEMYRRSSYKFDYPRKINFPDFSKNMVVAGSIKGIICLTQSRQMQGHFVALWNPAINHWKPIRVPQPKSYLDRQNSVSVGLGFDAGGDDFKIIRLVPAVLPPHFKEFRWSRVEIYSANRNSWKDAHDGAVIPFWPKMPNCNFIVKGTPYWVGIDGLPEDLRSLDPCQLEILGAFDPCSGVYKKVPYPEHIKNVRTWVHPVKLRDSIAALIRSPGESPNEMVHMYVMDDGTANWTKTYTIGPLHFEGLRIPLCFNTGEVLLDTWTGNHCHNSANKCSYFCDPKCSCVLPVNGIDSLDPLWYESYSHVESLVCVKGMELIGKVDKDKKTTRPRKKNWSELLCKDFELVLHL